MARIKPFRAVRPAPDKVHLVASRSYVSYSPEKLREKLDSNPYTFIHIINPDYKSAEKAKGGSDEIFGKVRDKYQSFIEKEVFVKEEKNAFYIYEQSSKEHSYTGIITGVSSEDYKSKKIKIHEATIGRREELFTKYLNAVDFNAEPVLLSYEKNEACQSLINGVKSGSPIYDFTTTDEIRHKLWRVTDTELIENFQEAFQSIENLYIADGHHRSASSANLSGIRENANPMANSNWFMAMLTQEDEMHIFGYHRVLRGISKQESDGLIHQITTAFKFEKLESNFYSPTPGNIHLYHFAVGWLKIELPKVQSSSPRENIDAQILSDSILGPMAGITDLKKDDRIKFIPGKADLEDLVSQINNGNEILFLLAPVEFNELKAVADSGEFMPPKSTYIEPKLRSGLTIFEISDE